MRVLELYCGIGGCAAALGVGAEVVAAIDIDRDAIDTYRTNFRHPAYARTIESIPVADYREWRADLWWLSPPCQPYTRRGRQRDLDDPRAESLKVILQRLEEIRPRHLALENVTGFAGSRAHGALREVLDHGGYHVAEQFLCPTELGIPNRRPRFYLLASQERLAPRPRPSKSPRTLAEHLDETPPPDVFAPPSLIEKYRGALDLVDVDDPRGVTACFTSSYGKMMVRSGSYLVEKRGVRRFTPREILRLLGFSADYRLPPHFSLRRGWALAGNSLSVDAVRCVLAPIDPSADLLSAKPSCSPGLEFATKVGPAR
jgi:site-specific DNA-cytosine methylase